jgi:hypothetical protein
MTTTTTDRILALRAELAALEAAHRLERTADTGRPVVVCTDKRGVFFGYAHDTSGDPVTLREARMCVYWDKVTRGVLGLAANGPGSGCRVGAAVTEIELRGVTCVIECSDAAAAAWVGAPWSS